MTGMRIRDRIFAPWERTFDRLTTPLDDFVEEESSSSVVFLLATIAALVLANSAAASAYFHFIHGQISIEVLDWKLVKTLHHWVNDGLMALFFFVVGLEIKRELTTGELADRRRAVVPLIAAVGGMVGPALLYWSLVDDPQYARGWAIPMATDIAFALGALVVLRDRIPSSLFAFLVALAIFDDLGAVIVIALFFTASIDLYYLALSGIILTLLFTLNRSGVRQPIPYFLLGGCLWLAMLKCGVHATLAGLLTAITIPSLPKYDPQLFTHRFRRLMELYERAYASTSSRRRRQRLGSILQAMETGLTGTRSPAYRLEHSLHLPVLFTIVPLFAFVNAGVVVDGAVLGASMSNPVLLAVATSLVFGKLLGIAGATWIAVRFGFGTLPQGATFSHVVGVSLLAGIGFTMSIFIAELAFRDAPAIIEQAKLGILCASAAAAAAGVAWLRFCCPRVTMERPADASTPNVQPRTDP
jgi:Na+:H+ antiporter, NhaA family